MELHYNLWINLPYNRSLATDKDFVGYSSTVIFCTFIFLVYILGRQE